MAALETLLTHRDEINCEFKAQKELLNQILEIQEKGFRRMEAGLERTCHHLQMYLTGVAAKDSSNTEADDDENLDGQQTQRAFEQVVQLKIFRGGGFEESRRNR